MSNAPSRRIVMQLNPEVAAYLDRRATRHMRSLSQEVHSLLLSARDKDVEERREQHLHDIAKREELRVQREEKVQQLREEARARRRPSVSMPVDTDYLDMNALRLPFAPALRHVRSDNPTGYKGVDPTPRGYRATLSNFGKRTSLGVFLTAEAAAHAYDHAARAMFGADALLNFPGAGELSARDDDIPVAELTAPPKLPPPPAADEVPAGTGEPEDAA